MEYRVVLGIAAIAIGIVSYIFYFYNLFKGKTKPHAFSWLIWGVLSAIAFFAQLEKEGGSGSWVTGFTAVVCLIIAITVFFKSHIHYVKKLDWFCLFAALIGIVLWIITHNPLTAVIIVSIVYLVGFVPTFRKGYQRPHEETAITFALNGLKFVFGIAALESLSITTWLYPASLVLANWAFVIMLIIRRKIKG